MRVSRKGQTATMIQLRVLWSLYFLSFNSLFPVESGGKVVFTLKRFENQNKREWKDSCCDASWGCQDCDTYLKVCVTDQPSPSSLSPCTFGYFKTGVLGDSNNIVINNIQKMYQFSLWMIPPCFTGSLKQSISNGAVHFKIHKTRYSRGSFGVRMESWDDDPAGDPDDLVDKYTFGKAITPSPNSSITTLSARVQGLRPISSKSHVTFEYQVYCDKFYFGPNCTVYCKATGDSTGHYTCNNDGSKKCHQGWYGANCTNYCVSKNDSQGHYSCNITTGQKVCHDGWYTENCTVFCSSHNTSRYSCNYLTGRIICHHGLFGPDCQQSVAPYTSLAAVGSVRSSWSPPNSSSSESILVVISTPSLTPFAITQDNSKEIQHIISRSSFIDTGKPSITVIEVCKSSLIGNLFAKSTWKEWTMNNSKSRNHDGKSDQTSSFKTLGMTTKYTSWFSGLTRNIIHFSSHRHVRTTTSSLLPNPITSKCRLQSKTAITSRELSKVESGVITLVTSQTIRILTSKAIKYPRYIISCRNKTVHGAEVRGSQVSSRRTHILSKSKSTTSIVLNNTDDGHPPAKKGDTGVSWRYALLAGGLAAIVLLFVVVIASRKLRKKVRRRRTITPHSHDPYADDQIDRTCLYRMSVRFSAGKTFEIRAKDEMPEVDIDGRFCDATLLRPDTWSDQKRPIISKENA